MTVKGARGVYMLADTLLADAGDGWDAVIVPGGLQGATNLAICTETKALLKDTAAAGKLVCAICASPAMVLAPLGILAGKQYTCYPGMEEKIKEGGWPCGALLQDRVVTDGNIITSRGAGTSGEFAIAIIAKLLDEETGKKIATSVLL
jgi:4-methyl-5(b-hydroxyethyl)-thiazole monophosphate biosynthesis